MGERKTAGKDTEKSVKSATASARGSKGFSNEERAAMRERVREMKAAGAGQDLEGEVVAKIAAMPAADRALAQRVHAVIMASAPDLSPRLWYGMPAYATDGKVVCHFQGAGKFKMRYATLGFSDRANLDEDDMWPVAYALKELTPSVEAKIAFLVKKATS